MGNLNKIRQVLTAGIIITVAILGVTLYLKLPDLRRKVPAIARMPQNIDISLRTVRYSETRDGVNKWVLEAQQADVEQKNSFIHLANPHFIVYLDRQPGTVTVTAGRADYNHKTRNVTLCDKVVATTDTGMDVETTQVFYNNERSLLTTDDHIKMVHRNALIEGDGMELNTTRGTVRLLRNVTATLKPGKR